MLDEKKFKTDVLQKATNSQQQWTTGKRPVTRWSFGRPRRLSDIKVSMLDCVFVLSPALGGT